ncbi:signal peptidase I [Undibacterium sp. LX40W]|uniref:Signal peptidase I n=1 Tax=Undibacterium nitidum TaxID=2762298 RepID=A0A923HL97_9BURK|nr:MULTISPECIES: signal peptidase I [Undibacterium]MBC3880438.1 signal peptidase I [Undibacterium nitidum]MBC3890826.1 signal peptidase I [Undibacterium sp. LX40W]
MTLHIRQLVRENKGFLILVFGMIFMRSALADWYVVPSSSMYPHLLEGDRVIANRIAYDIRVPFTDIVIKQVGNPQRGDIVTFFSPEDGTRLVKRVIGLPGDTIEMRDRKLIINGDEAHYQEVPDVPRDYLTPKYELSQRVFTETLGDLHHNIIVMPEVYQSIQSFAPTTIPEGQYVMLGDNRDNSRDSRYFHFVKRELITGRVSRLMFSLDYENNYMPRFDRIGARVAQ